MNYLKDDKFYLEIKLKDGKTKHVMIPSFDFDGMVYEYTYGDVVDVYTTRFNTRDELLDDIRVNGYADIENIKNDEVVSINFKNEDDDIKGCYQEVAYSNSTDIINYLEGSLEYRKVFEENFKRYVVGRVISRDKEYCNYLSDNFTRIYSNALRCDANYQFKLGGTEEPFSKYYNVRGHCLINHDKLEADFALERELKKGKPYDAETTADLKEALENANKNYPKRSVIQIQEEFLGEKFVPYPLKKHDIENKEELIENFDNYIDDQPLVVENGIMVDNLSFGASIQDETEYTIDPDVYEDFLNNNPVMNETKKRK